MPGVQKPHCSALRSWNTPCRSASSPVSERPSMVQTAAPSACTASTRQPRTISPPDRTVQAPPQPDLAVEPDRASAADALLAAGVRAGQPKLVAQEIGEMRARQDPRLDR